METSSDNWISVVLSVCAAALAVSAIIVAGEGQPNITVHDACKGPAAKVEIFRNFASGENKTIHCANGETIEVFE